MFPRPELTTNPLHWLALLRDLVAASLCRGAVAVIGRKTTATQRRGYNAAHLRHEFYGNASQRL
jgi:hypothetical protein